MIKLSPEIQALAHKSYLQKIKKQCPQVIFVSHVKDKIKASDGEWIEAYFVEVHLNNSLGGKDKIKFPLYTTPDQMGEKEYNFIIQNINNKEYERD